MAAPEDGMGRRPSPGEDTDDGGLEQAIAGEPAEDSPADTAILEQEEYYEGMASDRLPSEKQGPLRPEDPRLGLPEGEAS